MQREGLHGRPAGDTWGTQHGGGGLRIEEDAGSEPGPGLLNLTSPFRHLPFSILDPRFPPPAGCANAAPRLPRSIGDPPARAREFPSVPTVPRRDTWTGAATSRAQFVAGGVRTTRCCGLGSKRHGQASQSSQASRAGRDGWKRLWVCSGCCGHCALTGAVARVRQRRAPASHGRSAVDGGDRLSTVNGPVTRNESVTGAVACLLDRIHLQHLVAVVVDHFHGDPAALRRRKGHARRRVESGPGRLVDFGPEGAFELFVGLVGPREVGVTDEEAFGVVVGVDEPAGDVVGRLAADLAGRRVVNVDAADLDDELFRRSREPSGTARTSGVLPRLGCRSARGTCLPSGTGLRFRVRTSLGSRQLLSESRYPARRRP